MDHPLWCNTAHCTADKPGGVHQSDPTSVAGMSLSLSKPAMTGAQAVVTVTDLARADPDDPYDRFFISAVRAGALGTALTRMSGLAMQTATPVPVS